jgi:simple sugar transport system ATP-binding protein
VVANDVIGFAIRPGAIHGLIGENGAGKSTLVKIVYGVQAADSGTILWDGREVTISSPAAARRLGIGMVFQHFSLFDALSVVENVALGLDARLERGALRARITRLLETYSLPLDLDRPVHTLSVGERQRIEIVRCLLAEPRLLIMDEPTSVLTPQEVERLFAMLRRLADEGCAILYISHKLDEIRTLCSRATVLRAGRVVADLDPRQETARSMAEAMIGGTLRQVSHQPAARGDAAPLLAVADLDLPRLTPHGVALRGISFSVAPGEILGIAGVAGNGQAELVQALAGEILAPQAGTIRLDGHAIGRLGPRERRCRGLCTVPEERNGHAAVPALTLADNAVLTARDRAGLAGGGLIRFAAARRFAESAISRFGVRATGPGAPAGSLSGGNLQKFVVGREILQNPDVLVVAQPTWGVDAGAATIIHEAILQLAEAGAAIVVISQDLDELLALCDRLAVLNEGRLSPAFPVAEASPDRIGLLMGGVHGEAGTAHA